MEEAEQREAEDIPSSFPPPPPPGRPSLITERI